MTQISVILADDQDLIREGLAMLLSAQPDIDVLAQVSDGRAAVELARERVPDVVIMDLRMPVLSGIEATRQITASTVGNDHLVKVLALTTFDDDESVYGVLRAGASGFMLKHAAPQELPMAIRRVAGGESWLDPMVAGRVIKRLSSMADQAPVSSSLDTLTPRELDVLKLVGEGMNNAEISSQLFVSEATVKTHVSRILLRTGCRDRSQAVALAYRSGLIRPT